MYKYNGKVIREGRSWTDNNGVTHPSLWASKWSEQEKIDAGLLWEDNPLPFDSRYYWSHGVPKAIDDKPEFEADGVTPLLDENGKQVITRGVKHRVKQQISNKYKGLLQRPRVDTTLGFDVDGSYEDLKNFETGKEFNILTVKDADGINRTITLLDYDTIITAIKQKGLVLYQEKWTEEAMIDAMTTLDEIIAYENPVTEI